MSKLRKHLKKKSDTSSSPEKKNATSSTSARSSRLRKRKAESSETSTPAIAPKVRRRSSQTDNSSVESQTEVTVESSNTSTPSVRSKVRNTDSVQSTVNVGKATETTATDNAPETDASSDSGKPKPRIHAAPPLVTQTNTNEEDSNPANDSTSQMNTPVASETDTTESMISTDSTRTQAKDETLAKDTASNEVSAATAEVSGDTDDTTKNNANGPTVHAAPPEAYLRAQRAIAAQNKSKLGSAVISPPSNYGNEDAAQDSASKKNQGKWSDGDDGDKDKLKNAKPKRSRRKHRNWSAVESTDSEANTNYSRRRNRRKKGVAKPSPKAKAIKRRVMIDGSITVSDLAHAMSQKAGAVIKVLIGFGEMATMNDTLDFETASTIAAEFEFEAVDTSFQEDAFLITEEVKKEGPLRAPVVTIMGHVDHGKTTLLDTIRKANVAGSEAGGITQHTSAYQVAHDGQLITFIDTPGHEAFTAMRARGAQVTDIVILVVAADDGPMPQTIEALNHARASGVQLMVAVNKCDKPGANPDKVRQDMMRYELVSEEYGGDTIFVNVSALKGEGIDELLENITLLSEMGEYRAPVDRHAEGFVLEARLEKGRGAVATLLVKSGTLKQGDTLVLGNVWGRVRAMYDYNGKSIKKALPSAPVELIGLQDIPSAGDDFVVVKKAKDAKALVAHRAEEAKKAAQLAASNSVSLEELLRRQVEGEPVKLNLVIKSDVGGTLEAMKGSIAQIKVTGTEVNILHAAIGGITESDVSLAHTYGGIIIGFNVRPDAKARKVVNQTNVEVRTYSVIYEALEDLEKGLKGLLEPEIKEQWKGSAEIRETFNVPKVGTVAGCFVLDGSIARKHRIRLLRDGTIMWEGKLASLRRFKDDVREVEKGYECGMNLDGFNDIKVGDQLEAFMMEEQEVE